MTKNWKTSLAGIASIISGIALYFNHPEQIETALGLVAVGFTGLFAKDHNVSGTGKKTPDIPVQNIGGGGIKNPK